MSNVVRQKFVTRDEVRRRRMEAVFIFGDNMAGKGFGGQAKEMRGESNAIGIPTKWAPDMREQSFFTDADWLDGDVRHAIFGAFDRIETAAARGLAVVIPADGIGTGLADLPRRAPRIYEYIRARLAAIEDAHPSPEPGEAG